MTLLYYFFIEARAEILGKNFAGFLGDLKTPKGHFEISWPSVFTKKLINSEKTLNFSFKVEKQCPCILYLIQIFFKRWNGFAFFRCLWTLFDEKPSLVFQWGFANWWKNKIASGKIFDIFDLTFFDREFIMSSWHQTRTTDAQWSLFSLKSRTFGIGQINSGAFDYFRPNYQQFLWNAIPFYKKPETLL